MLKNTDFVNGDGERDSDRYYIKYILQLKGGGVREGLWMVLKQKIEENKTK